MSGIGQKRAAEDRQDRDQLENGSAPTATTDAPAASSSSGPELLLVKRGVRAEDAPSNNPFKGLATTASTSSTTGAPATGFAGFSSSGSSGFGGFGDFTSNKPTAAETAGAAAAAKFSFSFGAASAPAASTAAAAPAAATPSFSFNFGAASSSSSTPAATTATATTAAAPVTGGFNFGAKFDFGAGVKAFAAAQTAAATTAPAAKEAEEEVDPEAEVPVTAGPVKENALSRAAVQTIAAGDETDEVLMEVQNTKVFLLGFKEVAGEDGKMVPSATEKEWKEKGVGSLKVNAFTDKEGKTHHRLLMHSTQTKQVVLNITIDRWFAVTGTTDKTVAFRTVVMEEGKPKPHMYNLRVAETAVQSLADKLKELTPKKE